MTISRLRFSEMTHNHSAIGRPGIPRYIAHIQAHTGWTWAWRAKLEKQNVFCFVFTSTHSWFSGWVEAYIFAFYAFQWDLILQFLGHDHRVNEWSAIVSYTQNMAHGPGASTPPGTLLENPDLGPTPNLLDQNLHLNQIFRWLVWTFYLRSIAVCKY